MKRQHRLTRRRMICVAAPAALFGLYGCGGGREAPAPGSDQAAGVQMGMVTDVGGVGDLSFNMMSWNGLQRAEKELGVNPVKVESQQVADYAPNLERLAERGCKVVFGVGFALEQGIVDVAPRYPAVHFVIIDSDKPDLPNVTRVVFREEEGAFLAGALAGGMTRTDGLGFVGGMEIPLIKRFEAGYRAGARTTNPAVTVTAKYTNNWEDVARGKELALSLFNGGADIVFHASGRCGLGVIEAAREKGEGFWAIGVDADQDYLGTTDPENPAPPSRVLCSMMKRLDNVVFTLCKDAVEGSVEPGLRVFGLKEEGVGLSPLTYTREAIPPELLARVESLRQAIIDGEIKPPASMEALESWRPPAVAT